MRSHPASQRLAQARRHGEPPGQEESAGHGRGPGDSVAQNTTPQAHGVPETARVRDRAREGGGARAHPGEPAGPGIDRIEEEEGAGGFAQAG